MTAPIRSMPELIEGRFEVYRVVTDLEGIREGLIDRAEDLNVSRLSLDEAGGLTSGHAAKILCTPPMKNLGDISLPKILKATGMALVLVIDDERFAPIKAQMSKRKKTIRPVARIKRVKGYFTKENAVKHSKKRWDGIPLAIRKKIMRRVAKAGWITRRRAIAAAKALAAIPSPAQLPDCPSPACPLPNAAPIAGKRQQGGQPRLA